jgi:FixJ family two-component response regulator
MDFLEKPFSSNALLDRVEKALALLKHRRANNEAHERVVQAISALTPREREIMERIVKGQANKVIAIELDISERTVEIHRGRVMKKLGARSVAELVQCTMQARGSLTN